MDVLFAGEPDLSRISPLDQRLRPGHDQSARRPHNQDSGEEVPLVSASEESPAPETSAVHSTVAISMGLQQPNNMTLLGDAVDQCWSFLDTVIYPPSPYIASISLSRCGLQPHRAVFTVCRNQLPNMPRAIHIADATKMDF